jgi:hypothetical protein
MIHELYYSLWLGLQDAFILLALWLGCGALLWMGDEIRARREAANPDREDLDP